MLRKLVSLQPLLLGTLLTLGVGYLAGRLLLSRFDEDPPARIDRVVLPAEFGLGEPTTPPILLRGTLAGTGGGVAGTVSFRPATTEPDPDEERTPVAADGTFSLEVSAGPGLYLASFEPAKAEGGPALPHLIEMSVRVPPTDEFTLELELPLGRIDGSVLDADGVPIDQADVELFRFDAPPDSGAYATTRSDELGAFGFRSLPRAVYTLTATGQDGQTMRQNAHLLDDPQQTVTLAIGP